MSTSPAFPLSLAGMTKKLPREGNSDSTTCKEDDANNKKPISSHSSSSASSNVVSIAGGMPPPPIPTSSSVRRGVTTTSISSKSRNASLFLGGGGGLHQRFHQQNREKEETNEPSERHTAHDNNNNNNNNNNNHNNCNEEERRTVLKGVGSGGSFSNRATESHQQPKYGRRSAGIRDDERTTTSYTYHGDDDELVSKDERPFVEKHYFLERGCDSDASHRGGRGGGGGGAVREPILGVADCGGGGASSRAQRSSASVVTMAGAMEEEQRSEETSLSRQQLSSSNALFGRRSKGNDGYPTDKNDQSDKDVQQPSTAAAAASSRSSPPPRLTAVYLWQCQECFHPCNVMKSENRCICGHRFREHNVRPALEAAVGLTKGTDNLSEGARRKTPRCPCTVAKCSCKDFFYMVAEGAWIVRCRCKHKHIEHEPSPPYLCTKCKKVPTTSSSASRSQTGQCCGFDSPFVCNCNHSWASHAQVWEIREVSALPEVLDEFGDPSIVKRGL